MRFLGIRTISGSQSTTLYCPHEGDGAYYSIPAGGERSVDAVWTFEAPYAAESAIRQYLAFYPDGVDAIEVDSEGCRPQRDTGPRRSISSVTRASPTSFRSSRP
jgi:hypothetical protein